MSARDIVLSASGNSSGTPVYVDDVFSTYTYTGTGTSQAINTGIDLAGKGGLTWIKQRSGSQNHSLFDTSRGVNNYLRTDSTGAQNSGGTYTDLLTSFNSNGFTLGADAFTVGFTNNSGTFASWTFRKAPKFFDIVTYTGNGAQPRNIAHSLGSIPGMIIIKKTSGVKDWIVYHTSTGNSAFGLLNGTGTFTSGSAMFMNTTPSSSTFTVSSADDVNTAGATYVAYLFAHNAGGFGTTGTENAISCGGFTTDAAGASSLVNLGYEPQWILYKSTTNPTLAQGAWQLVDSMRGLNSGPTVPNEPVFFPNNSNTESAWPVISVSATGFQTTGQGYLAPNSAFIYMAIRRPNKPPTLGTQVYNAITRTGTGASAKVTGVGFAPDFVHTHRRNGASAGAPWNDKLRGAAAFTSATTTAAESSDSTVISSFDQDGITVSIGAQANGITFTYINHFFKRAKGFFDIVCYTGTGGLGSAMAHSLGVQPELLISKIRTTTGNWAVSCRIGTNSWVVSSATGGLTLNNTTGSTQTTSYDTFITPSTYIAGYIGGGWESTNTLSQNYVTYLFATLPGISKVGSYTGNGTSQTIACGFTTGARFIMIKRTDSTGDWYIWDSARGIVSANDPHLSLNSTAAEVTTDDSVDPDNSGFIVNQVAATNINVTSATYIFLAIA